MVNLMERGKNGSWLRLLVNKMLAIQKVFSAFLSLPGLFLLLLIIINIYIIKNRDNKYIKTLSVLTLILMYLLSTAVGSILFLFPLERQYLPFNMGGESRVIEEDIPVVVLGGGINYLDRDRGELNAITLQRLYEGYRVFRSSNSLIIFSGGAGLGYDSEITEAGLAREWLQEMGVAPEKIITDRRARTTYENGVYVSSWLKENDYRRVYLVSSAVHLPRAVRVFKKQGIDVIPVAGGYLTSHRLSWLDFLPARGLLTGNMAAVHEWLGIIWYHFSRRI
ncbi:MAG TPA: YdcF family protein [Halanaerobiales bacterium]|nr:YdcF family protein [Halanaerobiales bacterium]